MSNLFPRAVLFDLDDTLFDHQYSSRCGLAALCQRYPVLQQKPFAEIEGLYRDHLERLHRRVLEGLLSLDAARIERFRQVFLQCGAEVSDEAAADIAAQYHQVYFAVQRPLPGAIPLLTYLKKGGVNIAVVTNNLLKAQQRKLKDCGLEPYVDALIVSEKVGVTKPSPAIFEIALNRVWCVASEVVMVGDSWHADILGANNMGIRTLWLNRYDANCPDPDLAVEFHSFEPLAAFLDLLAGGAAAGHSHSASDVPS
jgi:HAD superfamily hydrolase (TIGR01509 family)